MYRTQFIQGRWITSEYRDFCRIEITHDPKVLTLGATVKVAATFYNNDGYETTPDTGTATITIYDSDGTAEITTQDMTQDSDETATWYYLHDIGASDEPGLWKAIVYADMTIDSVVRKLVRPYFFKVINI